MGSLTQASVEHSRLKRKKINLSENASEFKTTFGEQQNWI